MIEAPITHAIRDLNEAFETFKEANNERLNQLENKIPDPLTDEKLARLNEALDKASERLQKLSLIAQRPSLSVGIFQDNSDDHKRAFFEYLSRGSREGELRNFEQKRLEPGADTEGGYLLPRTTLQAVTASIEALCPMRAVSSVVETSRHHYELVLDDGTRDLTHWGEPSAAQRLGGTATPHLIKQTYPAFPLFAMPRISATLLEDTKFDIEKWLVELLSKKMARQENAAFIHGDGTTQPQGVLSVGTSADEVANRLQVIRTGRTGQFPAVNPDEALINLVHTLRPEYLQDALWMMPRSTLAQVRKMKGTDGHYIWSPDTVPAQSWSTGGRLLGYPVAVCDDLPALVTGTASISALFGNFKEGYLIVDRLGITVLRDPYSAKPDIDLLVRRRVGGGWKDYKAIKGLHFADAAEGGQQ